MQAAIAWFRSLNESRLRAPLGYFAATWILVSAARVHATIHLDTARDLLIARDCVVDVACSGAGPRTSFGGWTQGALWSHVLELRELLGLGLGALEEVSHLALAAAAALVPLPARSLDRTPSACGSRPRWRASPTRRFGIRPSCRWRCAASAWRSFTPLGPAAPWHLPPLRRRWRSR